MSAASWAADRAARETATHEAHVQRARVDTDPISQAYRAETVRRRTYPTELSVRREMERRIGVRDAERLARRALVEQLGQGWGC